MVAWSFSLCSFFSAIEQSSFLHNKKISGSYIVTYVPGTMTGINHINSITYTVVLVHYIWYTLF